MNADFIDTNVLVYSFDTSAPRKREVATALTAQALEKRSGVISYQVVQEFLNAATRGFESPMTAEEAKLYLSSVLIPLCVVWPSQSLYATGLDIQQETGYSFYDSLIVAGALESSCKRLLTEDLQDGRVFRGLEIHNPFR